LPQYKSPETTHSFLVDFNQDPILKYTCHNIDDESVIENINQECGENDYTFEKHSKLIKEHFDKLKNGKFVDYRVLNLISVYLTGKTIKGEDKTWSSVGIKENWDCKELHKWAIDNLNCVPNPGDNIATLKRNSGFKLSESYESHLTGNKIKTFCDIVLFFKSLFHIKADNSLRDILTYVNKKDEILKEIDIVFDKDNFWNNIELFANVDTLIQAYKKIINICLEYSIITKSEKPHINLSFYEETDTSKKWKCFCIHHVNSRYGKTINDTISRIGDRQTNLIKDQINGMCNLYIEALFEDNNSYMVNLWDGEKREYKKIDNIEGVKYIMKFCI
jgi:hypothetical protein